MKTYTYRRRIFQLGKVQGHRITKRTIESLASQFQKLSERGYVVPTYDDHYHDQHGPVPRSKFRRMAAADKRVVGYVSGLWQCPSGRALVCSITFVRERGRKLARYNRMGLSPVLSRFESDENGLSGLLTSIDLADPADLNQSPFFPVFSKRSMRMSQMDLPALNDSQLAVLQKLDQVRKQLNDLDWWSTAIRMLWPANANEILGDEYKQGMQDVVETSPEFAAMSLDVCRNLKVANPQNYPEVDEAKKFVDEQAARLGPHVMR